MESTSVFNPAVHTQQSKTSFASLLLGIPLYVYVVAICSCLVISGILWDIAWHMTIGRDGLFSAPHNLIYIGAAFAGIISGFQVLKTSFWGNASEKGKMVNFWGIFYSSLGGMLCIWGGFAAGTSAPFDDWWHNTYGLDVQIFSPPHTVLLLGLIAIQIGAMIMVLAILNRKEKIASLSTEQNKARINRLRWIFIFTAGMVLATAYTFMFEFLGRWNMHGALFYQIGSALFPMLIIAFSRASDSKWGATYAALIYMVYYIAINATLRIFPAEPLLGPIANPVTNYQTTAFPLLLVFPALVIDILKVKFATQDDWVLAVLMGFGFLATFLIIQYPAGNFLLESPYARNWFFQSDAWSYSSDADWQYRYKFAPWDVTTGVSAWATGGGVALVLGVLSAKVGLMWGKWMQKVQR
ncbi:MULTISPECIES: hypothetical protein [unclassified Arcicella]|uniref:hypothetical protein n=1 Tax=unclassified Arcicella TaxID=2644986 RepID=UPI00285EFBDD|nr:MULTISPECIES: hypothetical protein [unclassified Arcicella]MDR6564359.1 hypothetical protein [Arcicella sp. BE51]MDR6814109.1 hypothetical protein [Arcicella sp. BE140]MDR6825421.1 hypothetical protein [Arcicella sp. BE139]